MTENVSADTGTPSVEPASGDPVRESPVASGGVGSEEPGAGVVPRAPSRFRRWRKSRPFWGGLLAMLAGAEIAYIPAAAYKIILVSPSVTLAIVTGVVILILGLVSWMTPVQNKLYGLLTVLAAVVSFVTSNLGGLLVGGLLAVVAGALIFAWEPGTAPAAAGAHAIGADGPTGGPEVPLDTLLAADASPSDGTDGPAASGAPA